MNKPRIIKDFEKLEVQIQEQIKLNYPYGFEKHLIVFKNPLGKFVSALPFETEDRYYLVRMTRAEAQEIVEEDDDYNDDGVLKVSVQEDYEEKYETEEFDVEDLEDEEDSSDEDEEDD